MMKMKSIAWTAELLKQERNPVYQALNLNVFSRSHHSQIHSLVIVFCVRQGYNVHIILYYDIGFTAGVHRAHIFSVAMFFALVEPKVCVTLVDESLFSIVYFH